MKYLFMILSALATTALAQGSIECHFPEADGTQQCFGAVGQLLIFHLPNTVDTEIRLTKDKSNLILKLKKNQIERQLEENANQSELFTNGRFILGKAKKEYSGDYTLEEHSSDGKLKRKVNVHLEIKGSSFPVVAVAVTSSLAVLLGCVLIFLRINQTPSAVNEDITENPEDDVIYTHVTIIENTNTTEPSLSTFSLP